LAKDRSEALREEVDRAPMGAKDVVDPAQARTRLNAEGHVIETLCEVEAALAELGGALMVSHVPDLGAQIRGDHARRWRSSNAVARASASPR
jgi:hypothetical protein